MGKILERVLFIFRLLRVIDRRKWNIWISCKDFGWKYGCDGCCGYFYQYWLMTTTWKAINDQASKYIQQLLHKKPEQTTTSWVVARCCWANNFLGTRISSKTEPSPLLLQNSGTICLTVWGMQSLKKVSRKIWRPICFKRFTEVSDLLLNVLVSSSLELALYKSLILLLYNNNYWLHPIHWVKPLFLLLLFRATTFFTVETSNLYRR